MSEKTQEIKGNEVISQIATQLPRRTRRLSPRVVDQVNQLIRDMVTKGMILTLKVASCDCPNRDKCEVYNAGKEVVTVLDKLQNIKPR